METYRTGASYALSTDWQKQFLGMTETELRDYFRTNIPLRCTTKDVPFDLVSYNKKYLSYLLADLKQLVIDNPGVIVNITEDYDYDIEFVTKTWETVEEYNLRTETWVRERLEWNMEYVKKQADEQFDSALHSINEKINNYLQRKDKERPQHKDKVVF